MPENEREDRAEHPEAQRVELTAVESERIGRITKTWHVVSEAPAMQSIAPEGREIASAIIAVGAELVRAVEERDG